MRVLLITDQHRFSAGGAENYFFELKERLKKVPGMEVYSMGFGPDPLIGDDFFILKSSTSPLSKWIWQIAPHPFVYAKLRKQIKKIHPDVIHIHNVKQYTASLLKAIKPYPVVQTMHDFSAICPTAQNIHKDLQPCPTGCRMKCFWQHQVKYNRPVYLLMAYAFYLTRNRIKKNVKKFIAPSPLLVSYLKRNHFNDIAYVPLFIKERRSYSFETIKPHHFLFAGQLGKHKGVHILLDEFALACQKNRSLVLHIAGTGPEEKTLQKKVTLFGLEKNVFFLGWQKNLDTFYDECLALIFPSTGMESFGLVITEAMSHARPVIGINRGTTAWLVENDHTGLLFDPLKKGDLAEKILTLANQPELAQQLGKNGFEKLQNMTSNEEALQRMITVYSSVTESGLK